LLHYLEEEVALAGSAAAFLLGCCCCGSWAGFAATTGCAVCLGEGFLFVAVPLLPPVEADEDGGGTKSFVEADVDDGFLLLFPLA